MIRIMKKQLLLIVMTLLPMVAMAQTFVGVSKSIPRQMIPKDLCLGDHVYLYTSVEPYREYHFFTEDFESYRDVTLNVPLKTYTTQSEYIDETTVEWVVGGTHTYNYDFYLYYQDYDAGQYTKANEPIRATQTLFTNDDKFEFLIPVLDSSSVEIRDEGTNYRSIIYGGKVTALNFISENGDVLATLTPPTGYEIDSYTGYMIKMMGNFYVAIYVKKGSESGYAMYKIQSPRQNAPLKADVNSDGKVTISDAVTVVNIIQNNNGETTAPTLQDVKEIKELE